MYRSTLYLLLFSFWSALFVYWTLKKTCLSVLSTNCLERIPGQSPGPNERSPNPQQTRCSAYHTPFSSFQCSQRSPGGKENMRDTENRAGEMKKHIKPRTLTTETWLTPWKKVKRIVRFGWASWVAFRSAWAAASRVTKPDTALSAPGAMSKKNDLLSNCGRKTEFKDDHAFFSSIFQWAPQLQMGGKGEKKNLSGWHRLRLLVLQIQQRRPDIQMFSRRFSTILTSFWSCPAKLAFPPRQPSSRRSFRPDGVKHQLGGILRLHGRMSSQNNI